MTATLFVVFAAALAASVSATPAPVRVEATFASTDAYDMESKSALYCRAGAEIFTGIATGSSAAYCGSWNMLLSVTVTPVAPDMLSLAKTTFMMTAAIAQAVGSNATISAFTTRLSALGFFYIPTGRVTLLEVDNGVADEIASTAVVVVIAGLAVLLSLCCALSTKYDQFRLCKISCKDL